MPDGIMYFAVDLRIRAVRQAKDHKSRIMVVAYGYLCG